MVLVLDGCFSKIKRAQEHMDSVQRQISTWMDKRPYSTSRGHNADHTRHSVFIKIKKAADFERWSLIAGDSFHNLRAALDHLVYAVAVHEINPIDFTPELARSLAFPISDTPAKFAAASRYINVLSDPVRTEIETLQPYNRPHPKLPPLLAVLRDIDDIDKHRLLQTAITQVIVGEFSNVNTPIAPGETHLAIVHTAEIVDGTEIAALVTPRPAPNMSYDFKADLGISLPHAKGPLNNERSGIIYLFDTLRDEVTSVIELVRAKVV